MNKTSLNLSGQNNRRLSLISRRQLKSEVSVQKNDRFLVVKLKNEQSVSVMIQFGEGWEHLVGSDV